MASYGSDKHEVRIPDVEVLIQAASSDVAVVAFYMGRTVHDEMEIVASLADWTTRGAVRAVVQMALQALNRADWKLMDELDTRAVPDEQDPPF